MVPTDDPAATVRTFATRFVEQSFAEAVALLTADGRESVAESFPEEFQQGELDAEDALEQYWWGLFSQYGEFEGVREVTIDSTDVTVEFAFENGTETATLELDSEDDGITGFSFSPEYAVPDYVDESAFAERDVTVDAGDVDLDGILVVPEGTGPFPGVLLVHGAGIHDPDGTAGNSKLLKDLAWGLASEGIATLRYEKRLNDHEVDDEDYTLDRVVTDDAVAALSELAAADEVDEDAVFVAGHSQGGMTAPRIAARHGNVAGIVNLDGPADPPLDPEDADIIRYEFERDGDLDEEQAAQLEDDRETLRRIAAGDFEDDETLHGRPGTWHRSVQDCDPAGTASDLGRPVFVMKTCRADEETQPELVEFMRKGFREWQDADLPAGSRVELYEGVDHYFQAGPTPTTMDSLYFGGNVADYVVAELAAWIHETKPQ
ncbi:alpha/beta fold hydrolase [Haloarchaeobius sp. HME9146]|uniref:alpha/beta hydrolase n=1 Tax=Haloarchaeobius sp. HME9146 TaxID=2978732 RepID=UPI0021BF68EF|nr:alpha/beta fold hydrolase [Haloarchaeobius sp. HME9146]MCT9095715.1 alpha/beta fold hydrolase [Haloarchaeobius sp. HME9146]